MNPIFLQAESLSLSSRLPGSPSSTPQLSHGDRLLSLPQPPEREPIRHLLIGLPAAVQLTIHRLHVLHYADAGLWSPAIALVGEQLMLSLNSGEVMRVLVQYMRIHE
jgi:hypothetical protein